MMPCIFEKNFFLNGQKVHFVSKVFGVDLQVQQKRISPVNFKVYFIFNIGLWIIGIYLSFKVSH